MATLKDIAYTYDDLDEIWPLILGDYADITAAYYDGDYSKSLAEAQKDKHKWILDGLEFKAGDRIIDIGCGWGPMLNAIRERGGEGVGLTLSPRQAETCRQQGLAVHLLDWNDCDPNELGKFDAVVSLGAFEHFCSPEAYLNGAQEVVYDRFFGLCAELLRADGGMLYLQTMTWGPSVPWGDRSLTPDDLDRYTTLSAPNYSNERILGYVKAFFPGSWLPQDKEQIIRVAEPYFELVKTSDGRLDYIQTITEWVKAWYAPKPGLRWAKLKLLPNFVRGGRTYWAKMKCISENAVREVFIRQIFGHQRMFFRKRY
jgi:cyclopropane-fatty-acyl-phospholipid synthase